MGAVVFRHWVTSRVGAGWIVVALASGLGAACGRSRPAAGHSATVVVDDFGDTVATGPATRIVSLNPVTTELLFAAGRGRSLVGRTHWDLYPPEATAVPDLGDGMGPNVEAVVGTHPDLVILYASASNRRAATSLHAAGVRTLSVRTDHIADLSRFAGTYAAVTGDSAALAAADTALATVDSVRRLPRLAHPPRVVWHMGEPPLYVAGSGSFMGELIGIAGGVNAFGDVAAPSPQVSIEEVARRHPDLILVGPRTRRNIAASAAWRAVRAVRDGHLAVYDTVLVGRPGVRLGEAALDVRRLIVGHAHSP